MLVTGGSIVAISALTGRPTLHSSSVALAVILATR